MPLARTADTPAVPESSQAPVQATEDTKKAENEEYEKVFSGLYANLMGGNRANPLDIFSLLRQDFIETAASRVTSISPSSVMIRTVDSKFKVKSFKATESLYENFNGMHPDTQRFEILLQGQAVHHFRVPIETIGILGNFIVFVEKKSFNTKDNFRHISFIDLDYFRLAKGELPIFRVPIQGDGMESIDSFEVKGKTLYINNKPYEEGLFNFAAQLQRIIFNLLANATEPAHIVRVIESLVPFIEAFNVNVAEAGKNANDSEYASQLRFTLDTIVKQLEGMKANAEKISEHNLNKLKEAFVTPITETMSKVHENLKNQRALIGRLSGVHQALTIPRPAEVGKLKEKIVTVAVGFKRDRNRASDMIELAREFATNKTVRFSLATLAAAATAYYIPNESLQAIKSTLEMGEYISSAAVGKISDIGNVAWHTAAATFAGLNPVNLYEAYIADGAWKRSSVGISAIFSIIVLILGVPHIILNNYYLIKDLSKPVKEWRSTEGKKSASDFIKLISTEFIKRQQRVQSEYLQALSEEKAKKEAPTNHSYEVLTKMVNDFFFMMEERQQKEAERRQFTMRSKIWAAISLFTETHLPTAVTGAKWTSATWKKFNNIENFTGALSHFIFSFASFTKSGVFYATTWNYFYMARLLILNPRMAMTFMLYPNFFRRAIATELGQVTPPSFWNGGKRWIWNEVGVRLSSIKYAEQYAALKAFEESVIPIEKGINKEALTASLTALQKYLNNDLDKVVQLSERPGMRKKLSSTDIAKLSYDARTFFSAYYDIIVEQSMRQYLYVQASTEGAATGLSNEEIKRWFIEKSKTAIPNLIEPSKIVENQITEENYQRAYNIVHSSNSFVTKNGIANTHNNIRGLDAETNGKIKRYVIAQQQMKKPSAMARAIRSTIVGLVVDKPMELMILFILTAGVTDGPNKPLFDAMFSDNSAFFLSKNVFMTYLSGLVVSICADVWFKIQQDTRVDNLGGFDEVPENEFAKKGFFSWYRHQFAHNKKNRWWDHHKEMSELIYHNIGPAAILMTITGMATLGRLDVDFYFLQYFIIFFLPFTGLSQKIEQTFEIASGWVLKDVPKEIRSHPLIVEWAGKRILKLRVGFQIYYKLYENILGQFISNFLAITTVQNGTRALSRILFGGKTITEHLIEKTTSAATAFPILRPIDNACRLLFTGNYNSGPLPPRPK